MTDWRDPAVAEHILRSYRVWAVVGCSSHPWRASHGVSRYLLRQGYTVVPINPNETLIHGMPAYPDLSSVPHDPHARIEVVDVFRRSDAVLAHVDEAIAIGAKAIWMQLEVWNEEAAERAAAAGLDVVMDRCPAIDHPAMIGSRPPERIRRARPDEADALSALARRSKAHWGYEADFLELVREAMTLRSEDIARHEVWVIEADSGAPIGYHRVIPGDPAELEDLWVDPPAIGTGAGRRLFEHAAEVARRSGATALEIDADPHAAGFYERMGAVRIGETPSTLIPGRALPRMRVELDA